jgi:hypothetical protein
MADETRPKPTWTPIWLSCKQCRHQWYDFQPHLVPPATWIAHVTYHCPACGKGGNAVLLRSTPLPAESESPQPTDAATDDNRPSG